VRLREIQMGVPRCFCSLEMSLELYLSWSKAHPPLNTALIFNGASIMSIRVSKLFLRGNQARREMDIRMGQEREQGEGREHEQSERQE